MTDRQGLHVELPDHGPPSLRTARLWVGVTWAAAVLGVVLAIIRSDWVVAAYAMTTATGAAGWWLAVDRWRAWRDLTLGTLVLLEHATRREDDTP